LAFLEDISNIRDFSSVKIIIVENSLSNEHYQAVKVKINNDSKFHKTTIIQSLPGLARARNVSFSLIDSDIVHFMDDDISLPPNYFQAIDQAFFDNLQTGGIAPFIETHSSRTARSSVARVKKVFRQLLISEGRLSKSGRAAWFSNPGRNTQVDWLPGCCMVYRMESIQNFRFETKLENGPLGGYALGEDLDFSHRISKHTKLLGFGQISVLHKMSPNDRTNWIKMDDGIGRLRAFLLARFPEAVKISRVLMSLLLEGLIDLIRIKITKQKAVGGNYRQFARLQSFFRERKNPILSIAKKNDEN
jgi:glycosyltransferase involved in cell wall biosynthesis